jgi:hypothetical protein
MKWRRREHDQCFGLLGRARGALERLPGSLIGAIESSTACSQGGVEGGPRFVPRPCQLLQLLLRSGGMGLHARYRRVEILPTLDRKFRCGRTGLVCRFGFGEPGAREAICGSSAEGAQLHPARLGELPQGVPLRILRRDVRP